MNRIPQRLDQKELDAYRAMIESGDLLQQLVDRQLRRAVGISRAQFEILARVTARPEGVRMSDLAESSVLSEFGWLTFVICCLKASQELSWRRAFVAPVPEPPELPDGESGPAAK